MSLNSIDQSTRDQALQNRVIAAASKEAWKNPDLAATAFGQTVQDNPAEGVVLLWPVALDYENEYASALAAGNPNPGGDESVITDANIATAVQVHWPADPA